MSHSENLKSVKWVDKNDPFNKFCFKKIRSSTEGIINKSKVSN